MSQANASEDSLKVTKRRSLLWRIHFWAALIASPFALLAVLTGSVYIFTPQIESALYGSYEQVQSVGNRRPLDELVAAALAAVPEGASVASVMPGYADIDAVKVSIRLAQPEAQHAGHEGHGHAAATNAARKPVETTLYINPYTAAVIGQLPERERFNNWAKNLHSKLLQSDSWRWIIELAASWLMVMLLTGVYLWWPRGGQPAAPQPGAKGRNAWKQWHAFAGVVLGLLTFVMLATGITWSKYAGSNIRHARDATGQAPPQVPRDLLSIPSDGATMLTWQAAWDAARLHAPDVSVQLVPPRDAQGTWRVSNADIRQPMKKFDLVLDAYTAQSLYYAGWDKQTAFSKATAVGIPFHRGELGIWNQLLLGVFAAGTLFSLVTGWVMFFKRRRTGWLGLPTMLPGALHAVSPMMWLVAAGLLLLMPLLALSALLVLLLEWYWWWTDPNSAPPSAAPTA